MCTPSTFDDTKDLRSLYEGKTNIVKVRIARKWEEFDFGSAGRTRSVDMIIVDSQGDELHATIPDNLIFKFSSKILEGCLYSIEGLHLCKCKSRFRPTRSEKRGFFRHNTSIAALDVYNIIRVPHNFNFTEFEHLGSNIRNEYLTDVVGYLKKSTNIQTLKSADGKTKLKRELVLENTRGVGLRIALWGGATNQLVQRPAPTSSRQEPVVVAVCSAYVKSYQGDITLSSTNATRVYHDLDPRSITHMHQRFSHYGQTQTMAIMSTQDRALEVNAKPVCKNTVIKPWSSGWKDGVQKPKFCILQTDAARNLKIGFFRSMGRQLAKIIVDCSKVVVDCL